MSVEALGAAVATVPVAVDGTTSVAGGSGTLMVGVVVGVSFEQAARTAGDTIAAPITTERITSFVGDRPSYDIREAYGQCDTWTSRGRHYPTSGSLRGSGPEGAPQAAKGSLLSRVP